jgi:hypothetical protein
MHKWSDLTRLTAGSDYLIERVRLPDSGVAVEGSFEPPPLALLTADDQVFVAAFVKAHGSIKEMERLFGISYPTVKNRLNAISGRLDFLDIEIRTEPAHARPSMISVLEAIERGELDAAEAIRRLRGSDAPAGS